MKRVRIALVGFGTVGRAFARYIRTQPQRFNTDIEIAAIADSHGVEVLTSPDEIDRVIEWKESGRNLGQLATAAAPISPPQELLKDSSQRSPRSSDPSVKRGLQSPFDGHRVNPSSLSASGIAEVLKENAIPILVECLPTNITTGQPGLDLISTALSNSISVVTVDKGPVVHGYSHLMDLTCGTAARLEYSGTLGICPPSEVLKKRIHEIRGVLNGTTNYILTEMQERSQSFKAALAEAQRKGIAEPNPSLDVEGWDTAVKILILAKSLMSAESNLSQVSRIGLGPETESFIQQARNSGRRLRLIGRARIWQGRVRVSVAPKLVAPDSPFYSVEGTSKAALFRTEDGEFVVNSGSSLTGICDIIATDIAKLA